MPLTLSPILSTMPSSSIGGDDLVDRFADAIGELGGLLDPRAGLRPHMHLDLAAVDAREEVLAQIRGKRERKQGEADEPGDQLAAVAQTELEQTAIDRRGRPRSGVRSPAGTAPADCGWAWQVSKLHCRAPAAAQTACAADSSPAWGPACATGCRTRSARTPPPRRAGGTDSLRRRRARTSARRRCRCTSAIRSPGRRSAGRHPELRSRSPCRVRDAS